MTEINSIEDVKTDEQAREFIKAISNGIEDEMEFLHFYEMVRQKFPPSRGHYSPQAALAELVYCYGLDLT